MTWAKLDDVFPEHPKVIGLSDRAFRVHVTAICYAARSGTDGDIPRAVLPRLAGTAKAAAELVAAGLWTENAQGWAIHDYLEYNPSREEATQRRAARADAGRLGGQRSGEVRRSKPEANASRLLEAKSNPVPTRPDPDLSVSKDTDTGAVAPRVSHKPIDEKFLAELQDENPGVNVQGVYERAQNRKTWDGYKDKRRALKEHVGYALAERTSRNGRDDVVTAQKARAIAGLKGDD